MSAPTHLAIAECFRTLNVVCVFVDGRNYQQQGGGYQRGGRGGRSGGGGYRGQVVLLCEDFLHRVPGCSVLSACTNSPISLQNIFQLRSRFSNLRYMKIFNFESKMFFFLGAHTSTLQRRMYCWIVLYALCAAPSLLDADPGQYSAHTLPAIWRWIW